MTRKLNILSVNFPFKDKSVVQELTLSTERAFFDFDVIVVRPRTLMDAVHQDPQHRGRIDWPSYKRAKKIVVGKIEEIAHLLENGGILAVILDRIELRECYTGGYS